jgi:hypothetical protein
MDISSKPQNLFTSDSALDNDKTDQKSDSDDTHDQWNEIEVEEAWNHILNEFGDFDCYDLQSDERWQYMGATETCAGIWFHQFRHRALNGDLEYTYRLYPASRGWRPYENDEDED